MKTVFLFAFALIIGLQAHTQGIGINSSGANPDPSAGLDVDFNNKGFLPPRMTTAQRDAIQNPAEGLHIYNLTTKCVEVFYGSFWQSIHCGCSIAPSNLTFTDNGPLTYCLNQAVVINSSATQGGNPSSYTVSPVLPTGLFLNTITGQISGTPTSSSSAANYTITASNACGATTRNLNIEVIAIPATPSTISGPSAPTVNTSINYSISAISGATSYTWAVPAGWIINSGQGTTTINVTAGTNAGNVTVTATNHCGTSAASTKAVTSWRPITATGGTITNYTADGTNGVNGVQYRVHSFTTVGNSNFIVSDAGSNGVLEYLIVGGGGGGGKNAGAGGGAGGYRSSATGELSGGNVSPEQTITVLVQTYPITVGSGGSGGGTADCETGNQLGGSGAIGQGFKGGNGTIPGGFNRTGGGGGGAGGPGQNSVNSNQAGSGGQGLGSRITGTLSYYAGGGGGGVHAGTDGMGGIGGGGNGGSSPGSGVNGTGGGGGAGRSPNNGAAGGSGIVIIRYPLTNPNP